MNRLFIIIVLLTAGLFGCSTTITECGYFQTERDKRTCERTAANLR